MGFSARLRGDREHAALESLEDREDPSRPNEHGDSVGYGRWAVSSDSFEGMAPRAVNICLITTTTTLNLDMNLKVSHPHEASHGPIDSLGVWFPMQSSRLGSALEAFSHNPSSGSITASLHILHIPRNCGFAGLMLRPNGSHTSRLRWDSSVEGMVWSVHGGGMGDGDSGCARPRTPLRVATGGILGLNWAALTETGQSLDTTFGNANCIPHGWRPVTRLLASGGKIAQAGTWDLNAASVTGAT
eukprot:gene7179-biopygen19519